MRIQTLFFNKKPSEISDFEIKLESGDGNGKCYLINYSGAPVANGFEEYRIPLEDFVSQAEPFKFDDPFFNLESDE